MVPSTVGAVKGLWFGLRVGPRNTSPCLVCCSADRGPPKPQLATTTQFRVIVPLKKIEYGVYGDLILVIYSNPYSIYLRGTIRV